MRLLKGLMLAGIAALTLAGCGGGGGGGESNAQVNSNVKVASTLQFNIQAALLSFLSDQNSYRAVGEIQSGNTNGIPPAVSTTQVSGNLVNSPVAEVSYGNQTKQVTLRQKTMFLTLNGTTTSDTYIFDDIPFIYNIKNETGQQGILCDEKGISKFPWNQNPCNSSRLQPIKPTTLSLVGSNGDWLFVGRTDYNQYSATSDGGRYSWSLGPDTSSTATLTITYSANVNTAARSPQTETFIGIVTTQGQFQLIGYEYVDGGSFGYGYQKVSLRFTKI
jgi:hypothetical protein